jgi:hypothetical protein
MATTPPLGKATGYGIIIGLGFLFAFGMMLTTVCLPIIYSQWTGAGRNQGYYANP